MNKEWTFPGSPDQFVGVVMWAMTLRQAFKDDHPEKIEVADRPDMCMKVAGDYGITYENVAKEMVRNGIMALDKWDHMCKLERDLDAAFDPNTNSNTSKNSLAEVRNIIPDYFYAAMAGELFSVYGWDRSKELFYTDEDREDLLSGSEGWCRAFEAACKKLSMRF